MVWWLRSINVDMVVNLYQLEPRPRCLRLRFRVQDGGSEQWCRSCPCTELCSHGCDKRDLAPPVSVTKLEVIVITYS
jgi:radical SAM protein with 4Fe4S-binding SPASM domain